MKKLALLMLLLPIYAFAGGSHHHDQGDNTTVVQQYTTNVVNADNVDAALSNALAAQQFDFGVIDKLQLSATLGQSGDKYAGTVGAGWRLSGKNNVLINMGLGVGFGNGKARGANLGVNWVVK